MPRPPELLLSGFVIARARRAKLLRQSDERDGYMIIYAWEFGNCCAGSGRARLLLLSARRVSVDGAFVLTAR